MQNIALLVLLIGTSSLMISSFYKTFDEGFEHLRQKLWTLVFPFYILSLIFSVVAIIVPNTTALIHDLCKISTLLYLFTSMLFGLSHYFQRLSNKITNKEEAI